MSGHLLLFGQDITHPTPAVHAGNGTPYGEIQFPGGVITYRDLAGIDEAIAAHAELRQMLADAQARSRDVPLPSDLSGDFYAVPPNSIGGEQCSDPPEDSCSDAGCPVHGSVYAGLTEDLDGLEPLPPLPQRTPAGPPEPGYRDDSSAPEDISAGMPTAGHERNSGAEVRTLPGHPVEAGAGYDCNCSACLSLPARREPQPGGTIYPQLTPDALAGAAPLEQLAPEPEENEADA